jgi:NADP-reducing hydrogenase subunit HndD
MDNMVNIKINGRDYEVPKTSTVYEAARAANIDIPTLCYLKDINAIGACRICLVEVKGVRGFVTSCVYPVNEGMEIITNSPAVLNARKMNLELVLSNHNKKCLSCIKSTDCELQKLCSEYGVEESRFEGTNKSENAENDKVIDASSLSIVRDNSKCILCRRCVAACKNIQNINVIGANDRGFDTHIASPFEMALADTSCINCGQCIVVCPTGALHERDDTQVVFDAIADPTKHVAICMAPSVRATLGECFGYEPGTDVEGKMAAAAKRLGFDGVYNMNLTADLTIIEEANEFIERVKNGGKLPLITSCSPGWVKYCEHYYPDLTENLSTCKSPQAMFGALYKTYYAEKNGLDPKDIVFVSAIPCTAKKFEVKRDGHYLTGGPDVDVAITTRELARMIKRAGIDFKA